MSTTIATTVAGATTIAGATTTAAPTDGMTDWQKFGISTAVFFGALILWAIICGILSKMEDNRVPANGAAPIPDTSSDKGGNYASPSAADTNAYSSSSGSSGDAGYLPVAIPGGGSGNRI